MSHPIDWTALRARLLRPLALAPTLATVALTGCGRADGAAQATAQVSPGDVAGRARPEASVLGMVAPGHVVSVLVSGADPHAQVTVHTGGHPGETCDRAERCVDIDDARSWVAGPADAEGGALFRALVPIDMVSSLHVQVVSEGKPGGSGPRHTEPVETPVPDHPGLTELHDATPVSALQPGTHHRACEPQHDPWVDCTLAADMDDWKTLELAAFATGEPLPLGLGATTCASETAFDGDCCYVVGLFDPMGGPPPDHCSAFAAPGDDPPPGDSGIEGGDPAIDTGSSIGRPFAIGGSAVLAGSVPSSGWAEAIRLDPPDDPALRDRIVAAWRHVARGEHASVASFSRLNLELLALGAPASLVEASTRAIADEARHARLAFGVVTALTGQVEAPGPLPVVGALDRAGDAEAMLVAAIREGCVAETIGAVQLRLAAAQAADPGLREALQRVADDELRHAELSWALVRWLLEVDPTLMELAHRTFATAAAGPAPAPDPHRERLAAYGVSTACAQHEIAVDVLERLVRPCAAALCAGRDDAVQGTVTSPRPVRRERKLPTDHSPVGPRSSTQVS